MRRTLIATFAVLLLPSVASAQDKALELDQAVELMLTHSEDLKTALFTVESAWLAPDAINAAYQWSTYAELGFSRDESPKTNSFQPATVTTVPLTAGVSRMFATGTQVEAALTGSYFDAPFNTPFPSASIERGWRQGVTISARHTVWGSRTDRLLTLQQEQISRGATATAANVADGVEQGLASVHRLFWGWALAEEALRTAQDAVTAAEETQTLVRRRARKGLADRRDTLLADALVQRSKQQVLGAERALDQSRRALMDLIGIAPDAYTRIKYDLDRKIDDQADTATTDAAVKASLSLRALDEQRKATEISQLVAREELRPRLIAVGSLGQETIFPNGAGLDDEFGYTAFAGVRYERVFGDSDAVTRVRQGEMDLRRIDSQIARTKQKIRTASGEHNSAIRNARAQAENATGLVQITEDRFRTEQRNFSIGRIPLRDLIEARNQVTQAKYGHAAARVSLQFAATERSLLDGSLTAAWRTQILKDMKLSGSRP